MRFKHMLAAGLILTLAALPGMRADADHPLLNLLHQHHQKDCDVKHSVVRLPAQEIRVETSAPRITVGHTQRTRGFTQGMAFMPVATGPFVATMMPFTQGTQSSGSNPALKALHDLELHAGEASAAVAAHKAQMDHLNSVQQRVQAGMVSSFNKVSSGSDASELQKSIGELNKRIDNIEKLLIIHDNLLKEMNKK